MTDEDKALVQEYKKLGETISRHRRDTEYLLKLQKDLETLIEEHIWILMCSGDSFGDPNRLTFAGSKEDVWEFCRQRGQMPLDEDTENDCQFADHPMVRGIYMPVWGTAVKLKPTTHLYDWEFLKTFAARVKEESGL